MTPPEFIDRYRDSYGELNQPLLVGVLPLYNTRHASFLHNEVPGILIPEGIRARLEDAGEDSPKAGVEIAVELIEQIKAWGQGVYLMPPFSRYDMAAEIIERIKG